MKYLLFILTYSWRLTSICAIFGSANFNTYKKLYGLCKERGDFAYGSIYVSNKQEGTFFITCKSESTINLETSDHFVYEGTNFPLSQMDFYLGHTQAPTSSERKYTHKTSHPFRCGDWFVAHNGVLTNFDYLKTIIKNPKKYNNVDSSIIPALLDFFSKEYDDEIVVISKTLSLLKGTYGLWIFNGISGNVYLARCGSTVYCNMLTNDFSSLPYKKYVPLEEGLVYLLTSEGTTSVGTFESDSPFFIL